jgi:hypothetical protein
MEHRADHTNDSNKARRLPMRLVSRLGLVVFLCVAVVATSGGFVASKSQAAVTSKRKAPPKKAPPTTRPARPRVVDTCDVLGRVDVGAVLGSFAQEQEPLAFVGGREYTTRLPASVCEWSWANRAKTLESGEKEYPPESKNVTMSFGMLLAPNKNVFRKPELFEPVTVSGVSHPVAKDVGAFDSIMTNKARCVFLVTHPKGRFFAMIEYFGTDEKFCRPGDYAETEELLRQTVKVLDSGTLKYLN